MKRPWAVILATGALVGCHSAQPAANPFIRTTVPPPGTGQGAVVVPGEQYYPSGAPPAVPQGVAPVAPPPYVAPAVPVPPPGTGPPPVIIPPKDRYSPPGGSYQYNQSSNDRPKAPVDPASSVGETPLVDHGAQPRQVAEGTSARDQALADEGDAVKQALLLADDSDLPVAASYHELVAKPPSPLPAGEEEPQQSREAFAADARVEPPEPVALAVSEPRSDHAPRIVARMDRGEETAAAEETSEPAPPGDTVFRLSADAPEQVAMVGSPLPREVARADDESSDAPPSTVTIPRNAEVAEATGAATSPRESRAGAPPPQVSGSGHADRPDYAYARDYSSLRGRLEYVQSSRQWKLRYLPIDGPTDPYGGSMALPNSKALEAFKPGDLVAVRGSLAGRPSGTSSVSPLYELESIEPLAR